MKNSRILLSAITAGILYSCAFGNSGIGYQSGNDDIWSLCGGPCSSSYQQAGIYDINDVKGTNVIIDNESSRNVFGGISRDKNADNNMVTINNKAVIYGVTVGYGNTGANGNILIINQNSNSPSAVNNFIVGISEKGKANNNIAIINDAYINDIFLGISHNGEANDNMILLNGGNIKNIIGGYSTPSTKSTGNQIVIANKNINVGAIWEKTIQEYLFVLPTDIEKGDIILSLSDNLAFNTTDKINVAAQGFLTKLKKDESVILIDSKKEISGFDKEMLDKNLRVAYTKVAGVTLEYKYDYEFELSKSEDNKQILATVKNELTPPPEVKKESKALSEGTAGAAAAVVEAGSVMADKGISSAMAQSNNKANLGAGKTTDNFGAIGFGSSRYQTGSYVDSKSINISVGVALGQEVKYGKVLVGPFIELGYSDYETHNDFGYGDVRGDGISKYLGGGVFARYDWNSYANGHPYVEGSIRFGKNKNSFDSSDLGTSYKSNAFYYGAHLGLGYIVEFQNNSNLDFYAKYFYTHLNSDDVTTTANDHLNLDAVNSHKTRFGARYNHALNNSSEWQIKPYVGLAWEHEYKGAANATTSGYAIEAPSLEGSSGLAEIGVNIGKEKGLSADLGVAGYTGKRRGVAGNIMVKYEF